MINDVKKFMQAADQSTDSFNVRQTALYVGLQLEEIAEKLRELFPDDDLADEMFIASSELKSGDCDWAFKSANREALLDADIDLLWVTIGSALSQGADIHGAMAEITRSNMSKLVDGRMVKDGNGKVTKPAHYSPPDLTPYIKS